MTDFWTSLPAHRPLKAFLLIDSLLVEKNANGIFRAAGWLPWKVYFKGGLHEAGCLANALALEREERAKMYLHTWQI